MNLSSPAFSDRHQMLRAAETMASQLFSEVEHKNLIRPGVTEKQLNSEIYDLAQALFGIKKYWHKRIVRAGPNTVHPYRENPPDLLIQPDDIIFLDFGPIFNDWEADFGRTFVLGSDSVKLRIKAEVEEAWYIGKEYFSSRPDITGAQLYGFIIELTKSRGWIYPQEHCGHLVGNFPHETLQGEEVENYIHPENHKSMRSLDKNDGPRDWILEIHFVDEKRNFGAFFEQLLTVPLGS